MFKPVYYQKQAKTSNRGAGIRQPFTPVLMVVPALFKEGKIVFFNPDFSSFPRFRPEIEAIFLTRERVPTGGALIFQDPAPFFSFLFSPSPSQDDEIEYFADDILDHHSLLVKDGCLLGLIII
jgi:hypothetical protein